MPIPANGRALRFFKAAALMDKLLKARRLPVGRSYDAHYLRGTLQESDTMPCVPYQKSRDKTVEHDKYRYRRLDEMMSGRQMDWREVAACYDQRQTAFFSAIELPATAKMFTTN